MLDLQIEAVEGELSVISRIIRAIESNGSIDSKIEHYNNLKNFWNRQLEQLYLEQNLNNQKVEHDYEELSDYYEREEVED